MSTPGNDKHLYRFDHLEDPVAGFKVSPHGFDSYFDSSQLLFTLDGCPLCAASTHIIVYKYNTEDMAAQAETWGYDEVEWTKLKYYRRPTEIPHIMGMTFNHEAFVVRREDRQSWYDVIRFADWRIL